MSRAPGSLVPFGLLDELGCYHDAPDEPNSVHLELRLPGRLDETAFRAAVNQAIAQAPRAQARRARVRPLASRYRWEPVSALDADPVATTAWSSEDDLGRLRARFFATAPAIDAAPPLRLLLAKGRDETCVILNAHHAAFDGIWCLELLRRVARAYLAPGHPPPVVTPPAAERPSVAGTVPAGAAPASRGVLPRRVTRIAPVPSADRAGYGFHVLPPVVVPSVMATAPGAPVTVNDVLVAALVATIGQWNTGHGRPARDIKVTMPINTRRPGQELTTGNCNRLVTVSAAGSEGSAADILGSIARQTCWAKGHPRPEVGLFSRGLAAAPLPVAVKRAAMRGYLRSAGQFLCDTTLLSNLGNIADPPRFGQLAATRVIFSAPAHMPRGLSVGAISTGGQLQLCLRYRHALLTEEAAASFAGLYRDVLAGLS
jgi:NRPS condensation-like uncharacterized protein